MRYSATKLLKVLLLTSTTSNIPKYLVCSKGLLQEFDRRPQKRILNQMNTNINMYVSKPPKFDGKRGSAYVIWDIKLQVMGRG
jgi:hypothetical protein